MRELVVVAVLGFASFFLTLASLPLHAIDGGASRSEAGIVTAAMLVSTVAFQFLVPAMEHRLGTARLLAAGLVLLGAPTPLYLAGHSVLALSLVSVVRGAGFAILTVLVATVTVRLAPEGRRGEALGLNGLAIALTNLLGVPAGAALAGGGHFRWVAIIAAMPVLAVPLTRSLPSATDGARGRITRELLRLIAVPCVTLGVVTLSGAGLITFLPVELSGGATASVALFVFGGFATISRWRAGHLADRAYTAVLLPAASCSAGVGLLLVALGLSAGTGVLLLGAALLGLGYGGVQNLSLYMAFGRAGPGATSSASAAWNAAFDSGLAVGAWGVGVVAAQIGLGATYVVCAALVACTIPLTAGRTARRSRGRA